MAKKNEIIKRRCNDCYTTTDHVVIKKLVEVPDNPKYPIMSIATGRYTVKEIIIGYECVECKKEDKGK